MNVLLYLVSQVWNKYHYYFSNYSYFILMNERRGIDQWRMGRCSTIPWQNDVTWQLHFSRKMALKFECLPFKNKFENLHADIFMEIVIIFKILLRSTGILQSY